MIAHSQWNQTHLLPQLALPKLAHAIGAVAPPWVHREDGVLSLKRLGAKAAVAELCKGRKGGGVNVGDDCRVVGGPDACKQK